MLPPEKREGRRTDYRRDTEMLLREQFLDQSRRERDRLKGKIEKPEQKLSDEVKKSFEKKIPDAAEREKVYRLMSVYEFIPSSGTELGFFLRDREILEYKSVMLFYEFLNHTFGYRFELSFPWFVKGLTKYEEASMQFSTTMALAFGVSKEKKQEYSQKWHAAADNKMNKTFTVFRDKYGTGFFKNQIERFQKHYNIPLSGSGIFFVMKQDVSALLSADKQAVQEKMGPLFQGNEMICLLYSVRDPKTFEAMALVAKTLKRHKGYEPLTPDIFDTFGYAQEKHKELPDFLAFWNWLEDEFSPDSPVSLRSVDDLLGQWKDMKPAAWNKATADRIRDVAKEYGQPQTVSRLISSISDFYWSDAELEALRSIKKLYTLQLSDSISVGMLRSKIKNILAKDILAKITNPQNVPLYRAAVQFKYDPKAPLEDFDVFENAEKGIAVLEEKIPNARDVLRVLAKTGLPLRQVSMLASETSRELMESMGTFPIFSIVRNFSEHPDLLAAWETLCQTYAFDEIELGHLEFWLDLPPERRNALVDPQHVARVRTLKDVYHFQISPPILITFLNDFDSDENFRKKIEVLLSKPCLDFFKKHGKLFEEKTFMTEDWQQRRLLVIADFFEQQKTDKRFLRWAKRWNRTGNGVDTGFMASESLASLSALDRPEFPRLIAVCKTLKIEIKYISDVMAILDHVSTLEKKEFAKFMDTMERIYGVTHEFYMLDDLAKIFEDPQARAFFENPEVQDFYKKLQTYGYSFSGDKGYVPFEDRYKKLQALYETKGLFEAIERLGKAYGLDVKKLAGEAEEVENGGGIFGRISDFMMPGVSTRGFDFLPELKVLIEQGDFEQVVAPETVEFVQFCAKTYGYRFSLLNLNSIMTVVKSPRLKGAVRDPRLLKVIKRVELAFSFDALDLFIDIMDREKEFEEMMDLLESEYAYRPEEPSDLFFIVDLLGREAVVEKLKSKAFHEMVEKLKKERKYEFQVTDIYGLFYLDDHRGLVENIYDPAMEDFAERIFGKRFGKDIAGRIKFLEIYRDPAKRKKLDSDNFRNIREKLRREIGIAGGADDADGLLFCMDHPEIFSFLKTIDFKIRSLDYQAVDFFDAMPSLAAMAGLHAERYIAALKKEQKGWWYDFNFLDGHAWKAIIAQYPSAEKFAADAQVFQKRIGERSVSANDIYLGLLLGDRLSFDRSALEHELKEPFKDDIHRVDSNFDSYHSYNDLSKFSVLQLNKMRLIRQWLASEKARQSLGDFIRRDVQQYPYTELGSVIVIKPNGAVENHEYPPKLHFQNGSYDAPAEAKNEHAISLATAHLHALKFDQGNHAGPSGSRFSIGGDISVARLNGRDSVVITSLSEKQFAVHFYTASGDVAFLGRFEYEKKV